MEKNIKDYLHLYIGCEIDTTIPGDYIHPYGSITLTELRPDNIDQIVRHIQYKEGYQRDGFTDYDWVEFKLILRPLSDMTEDEAEQFIALRFPERRMIDATVEKYGVCFFDKTQKKAKHIHFENIPIELNATTFIWLLSHGFDLFGLIDAGLAIDKTKLNEKE
jgi:hypothetical protein